MQQPYRSAKITEQQRKEILAQPNVDPEELSMKYGVTARYIRNLRSEHKKNNESRKDKIQ